MFCLLLSGVALKHVYDNVFTSDSGMRRNVPKVLVVVTDGRSQDEVKKNAEKLQHSGWHRVINSFQMCSVCGRFPLQNAYSGAVKLSNSFFISTQSDLKLI